MTHTYLVEDYFCPNLVSLRNQILGRYTNFVQKLKSSPSKEIRFLSDILENDARSQLCLNLRYLSELTNVNPVTTDKWTFKSLLPRNSLPQREQWRIRWIDLLLDARRNKTFYELNMTETRCNSMLESLCIS